jgi:hypothetical protein
MGSTTATEDESMLSTMTLLGWPEYSPLVAAIKCLTGPGTKIEALEGAARGRAGREGGDNREVAVEREGKADKRNWSGETVESAHSPMVSAAPTAPICASRRQPTT